MKWNGIELHIGDKVKLANKFEDLSEDNLEFTKFFGKVVTIDDICNDDTFLVNNGVAYYLAFNVSDIAAIETSKNSLANCADLSFKDSVFIKPEYTAKIKIGNLEINLTDKTFTDEQIKNMKEMLGWDVINLVEV